jgi:serine/threonine protein kinase
VSDRIDTLQQLCAGCMGNRGEAERCPDCDWVEGTMPENPSQLLPRTILEGKYMLGRALGQGGFGITYLAWDHSLSRKLAIKEYYPREICSRGKDAVTLQPNANRNRVDYEWGLAKFKEEGQNLARFRDYPGIVGLLDYFEANGTAYIVMLYVEGMTFKQYLQGQPNERISFNAALAILGPVMDALREVHSVGMLHRDISPDNIYLSRDKHVKILDFGATRYAMRDQTRSMTVLFKPGYAPFEQYSSRGNQGPWSDVYAVGATFYRAITGHAPPDSPDRMNRDELMVPSAMGVKLPPKAEPALLKALAVRPENRFQSMQDFQEAIMVPELIPLPTLKDSGSGSVLWKVASGALLAVALVLGGLFVIRKPAPVPPAPEKTAASQEPPAGPKDSSPPAVDDSQLKAQLLRQKQELEELKRKQQAEDEKNARTAAAKAAHDLALKRDQEAVQNAPNSSGMANQSGPSPQSLTIINFELAQYNRLAGTRTQQESFMSAATQRIICSVGGPTPGGGAQPFSAGVRIVFVTPSGATKNQANLKIQTNAGQASWVASAYIGSDDPGTLERGTWHVQVFSGDQLLRTRAFTVF